jgi:hypothetical protein
MSTDAPDLIIENLIAASDAVTIVIRNAGTAPVPEDQGFWVDFYINPNPPPTQVNEVWNDGRAAAGMVWGVDGPILSTLTPGGVITLTVGDAYYVADPDHSNFPGLTAGDTVYVQVDSVNLATNYGNVLESHELLNDSYNNIFTTATIAVSSENLFIPNRSLQIEQPAPIIEGLPQRP